MTLLDMRTVLSSYVISSLISVAIMASLWAQNRRRSPELAYWLVDFIMQFLGLLLIVLRGNLPDFFSMVLANTLIIGGTLVLLIGLERYFGKTSWEWYNYIYLGLFFFVQMYFVYIQPILQWRTINISVGILVMCGQCAWLLMQRVDRALRPWARPAVIVLGLFSLVSLVRIFIDLAVPQGTDVFKSGLYDTLVILIYQMLFISLTFALVLMVNQRINTELQNDIMERKLAEAALKVSEEKFSVAFQNSPDAIVISSLPDGKIIDANESFFRITQFTREETLGKTTTEMKLWGNLEQRNEFVNALQKEHRALNIEANFRMKLGDLFTGLISGESIQLQSQTYVLSVIHDITQRKQTEEALRLLTTRQNGILASIPDIIAEVDNNKVFTWVNQPGREFYGEEVIGKEAAFFFEGEQNTYADVQPLFEGSDALIYVESWQRRKDGEKRLLAWWCRVLKDPEGNVIGTLSTAHDITERKRMELIQNTIYRITQSAITSEGIEALYHSIHSILGELIPAENFYVALYDPVNELISFPYYVDQYDEPPSAPIKIQGLTGYVIRSGRSLLATREIFDRLVQQGEVEAVGTVSVDWLGVPLKAEGRMIGVITVQSYTEGIHFDQEDVDLLEFVSTQVAQAIERKRLEEEILSLSLTDELTGLYNRRGFTLLAEQEVKQANRMKRAMLLLFGDVDNLKMINDVLGHAHGDLALKEVSAILKKCFREADILARVGGDEFVVLALDASIESAEVMANRLQASLEAHNLQRDETYPLSLSMGIARYDPEAPCTLSELIAQADGLMYLQKQAAKGKKRVGLPPQTGFNPL
jgi:diguanylate cyclase (GGDEF)-like protein/PAS domain S-box-containing protein